MSCQARKRGIYTVVEYTPWRDADCVLEELDDIVGTRVL